MTDSAEVLTLRCRDCGVDFPSQIQFTRESWEGGGNIQGIGSTCPNGHRAMYDKKEYFFTTPS